MSKSACQTILPFIAIQMTFNLILPLIFPDILNDSKTPIRPAVPRKAGHKLGQKSRQAVTHHTVCTHTCAQIDMPHNGILKWNHLERACEKLSLGTFSHRVTWRLRWQAVARQCVHFHLEKWDSRSRTESSNQFSSRKCSEISLMCVRPQWFPVAVQKE